MKNTALLYVMKSGGTYKTQHNLESCKSKLFPGFDLNLFLHLFIFLVQLKKQNKIQLFLAIILIYTISFQKNYVVLEIFIKLF